MKKQIRKSASIGFVLLKRAFPIYMLCTVLITLMQIVGEYQSTKDGVLTQLAKTKDSISDGLTEAVWTFNKQQIESTINGINQLDYVVAVSVEEPVEGVIATVGAVPKGEDIEEKIATEGDGITEYKLRGTYEVLYEYKFPLTHVDASRIKELAGHVSLYTSEKLVLEKLQDSLVIIIVMAILKTIALWMVFLWAANKYLIHPLLQFVDHVTNVDISSDHADERKKFIERDDEIGLLAFRFDDLILAIREKIETIRQINVELEDKVEERTREISKKNQNLRAIFDNVPVGVLTIVEGLKLTSEYSKSTETILLTSNIAGESLFDVLLQHVDLPPDEKKYILSTLSLCLGEDEMNYMLNAKFLPDRVSLAVRDARKVLDLSWSYVLDHDHHIDKIILTLKDVTKVLHLEQQAHKRETELAIVGLLLEDSDKGVNDKLASLSELIEELSLEFQTSNGPLEISANSLRLIHTIKGNARSFGYSLIANECHFLEELIEKSDGALSEGERNHALEAIKISFNHYYEHAVRLRKIIPESEALQKQLLLGSSTLKLLRSIYADLSKNSKKALPVNEEMLKLVDDCMLSQHYSLDEILGHLDSMLIAVSGKLGKLVPRVRFLNDQALFPEDMVSCVQSIFGHLFANSLDHGFPKKSFQAGASYNEILLDLSFSEGAVTIRYADNGLGLDLVEIERQAAEQALIKSQKPSPEQVAEFIFAPKFSSKRATTELSGRGVGLDAVRAMIEEKGGKINVLLKEERAHGRYGFELEIVLPIKNLYRPLLKAS